MLKTKVVLGLISSVCLCALVVVVHGQRNNPGKQPLTALDYVEIQQLYARYNYGSDTAANDGNMYAGTFTSDGVVLIMPNTTIQGRKNLAEFIRRGNKGPTTIHHFISNLLIEPSPEGAIGSVYLLLANIGESGQPNSVTGGGIYRDLLVRTSEGWRFKKRTYFAANSRFDPNLSQPPVPQ
jgi:hypothetical protein